jgi:poly(glycerol-phosphate) alpha-glucosyltransferase
LGLVGYGDAGVLSRRVAEANARGELQRVRVFGPVFGSEKAATLSAASAFILPSMSEGLPMAALEAMAYRLPCLLSSACNLPEAVQTGAAISAEPNVGSLVASLQACFQFSPGMRAAMGSAGRHLVSTHFSWPKVALQTRELYDWVLGRGSLPGFVQLA